VYLDDSPLVLPSLRRYRPEALVCRFIRPWNEPLDGVTDIGSWADFYRIVMQCSHDGR
jgi:hypothetical protein